MTKVKVCGLMRPEDVEAVNRHGADYAGFVFAESRRRVAPDDSKALIRSLNPMIMPVGVFVDEEVERVADIANFCALGAVQLHGGEGNGYVAALRKLLPAGTMVIKAVRVRDAGSLKQAETADYDLLLLDAYSDDVAGGAGKTFDWNLLEGFGRPYLLAGGLKSDNVAQAVSRLKPYGVDVSTGVETDGKKDETKIAEFIEKARSVRG